MTTFTKIINRICLRPLVLGTLSFVLGLITTSYRLEAFLILISGLGASLILLAVNKTPIKTYLILFLLPACFLLGCLRTDLIEVSELSQYLTQRDLPKLDARVDGIIDGISAKENSCQLTLKQCNIYIEDEISTDNKLLIQIPNELVIGSRDFRLGDWIEVSGKLYQLAEPRVPGQFDEAGYYRARGIDGRFYVSRITGYESKEGGPGYGYLRMIYQLKTRLSGAIYDMYPAKEAGSLISILTGDRAYLDGDLKNQYQEAGIGHILAISALHIMLIGMSIHKLILKLTKSLRISALVSLAIIWTYVWMTGFGVSARRAGIMISLMLLGRIRGLAYDGLSACLLAAGLILAFNPLYIYDTGFILSFAAVSGIYLWNSLARALRFKNHLIKLLGPAFMLNLFTLPVQVTAFHRYSLYSILFNLLVIPLMSYLLVSGGLGAGIMALAGGSSLSALSKVLKVLAELIGGSAYYILRFYDYLSSLELKLPGALITRGQRPGYIVITFYILILSAVILIAVLKQKRYLLILPLALLLFLIPIRTGDLRISFIDVGQGKSILMETKNQVILVDAGSTSVNKAGSYRIIPYLKYRGINRLDKLLVTHSDKDHISGIEDLLEEGYPQIDSFVFNCKEEDSKLYLQLKDQAYPVRLIKAGDCLYKDDDLIIECISPSFDKTYGDTNAASVVLKVKYKDLDILLTGDSDSSSEREYAGLIEDRIDIYDVAHHGSDYSSSEALLRRIRPRLAFISCDKHNRYDHPGAKTLERLADQEAKIYNTAQAGTMIIEYDGDKLLVRRTLL